MSSLRSLLAGLMVALALACPAMAQPLLGIDGYRDAYIAAVREAAPDARIEVVSPYTLHVTPAGREEIVVNLDNSFAEYRGNPADLDRIVGRNARVMLTVTSVPGSAIDRDQLVVLIRPDDYVSNSFGSTSTEPPPLTRPFGQGLSVVMAVNSPDAFAMPGARYVHEALGTDDAALWRLAMANTHRLAGDFPLDVQSGVLIAQPAEGLGPSALLDDDFWSRREVAVLGPDVVVLLYRSGFAMASATNADAVRILDGMLHSYNQDSDMMSDSLFVRRRGVWSVYAGN